MAFGGCSPVKKIAELPDPVGFVSIDGGKVFVSGGWRNGDMKVLSFSGGKSEPPTERIVKDFFADVQLGSTGGTTDSPTPFASARQGA